MAAESDGEPGLVASTVEEQPMDLSKRSKKTTRLVPPLIPISMLPSGFHQRRFLNLKRSASEDAAEVEADSDWRMTPKRSRLDRARSVPQLNPLPALQRHKSLSESRIAQPVPEEPCPYLGYYSQMLHHFQAKCVLEQQVSVCVFMFVCLYCVYVCTVCMFVLCVC